MAGTKQASARPRIMRRLGCVAAGVLAATSIAQAASGSECNAVNQGALNVELGETASMSRVVALKAGDTLTFSYRAPEGPLGTVALLQAAHAPRLLLVGPAGTRVAFVASSHGSYTFEFSRDGEEAAEFSASCAPARSSAQLKNSGRKPRGSLESLVGNWDNADALPEGEPSTMALETRAPVDQGTPTAGILVERPALHLPKDASGAEIKLQWRDPRLSAAGPASPEVDGNASGVNIGLNMKLQPGIMVGALAQFDQAGEHAISVPRSLLDQGWMVGPVANIKLAPGLSLDAQAAWGVVQNDVDDLAGKNSSASRRTVSARLADVQSFGPWRLTPSLSVSHSQDASVPAPGAPETVAPSPVGFGRVDLGPELAYHIDLGGPMFIEPKAALGQFWNFDSLSNLAPGNGPHSEPHLKAQAGVTVGAVGGPKLQAQGGVEKGDAGAADVWSGRVQLSVPMQ
jgi:hypothetical protein